jgi:chromate transport protein ChrA
MKAAVKGISPAVIGVLLVTLAQMAPHALPDPVAGAIFALAAAALLGWNVGPLKLMLAGALSGARSSAAAARLSAWPIERRKPYALPVETDLLPSVDPARAVAQADREPLRE